MIYIYLNKKTIKALYLKKTFFKQEQVAFFEKTYGTSLFEKDKPLNIDLLASALKETISSISEKKINDNQVFLIIPQEFFYFFKTDVPLDIAKEAVESFIADKAISILPIMPEEISFDYFVKEKNNQKIINFFALEKKIINLLHQAFSLIDLKIINIMPDSLAYFKLFEKTLRADKKENILYINIEKNYLFGYLFDNFGLTENKTFYQEIKNENNYLDVLKKIINDIEQGKKIKLNRLIISGKESENIRQDTFTRDVGVWTNPLKRIVPNFYDQYIKMLIVEKNQTFPILAYDVCFGAFIFYQEEKFSLLKNHQFNLNKEKKSLNQFKINSSKKEVFLFILSFIISFALFFLITNFKNIKIPELAKKTTPTITPAPTSTPTPTPSFKKEELKIQVLNGSGVAGKASEMKNILKKKGYQEIITGNADNFDYKITEIKAKKSKSQAVSMIKEDLKDYLSSFKETELPEKETPDVIIVFGSDFK